MATAVGRTISHLRVKASWVSEMPYTIWKLSDPQSAAVFLAQYDSAVADGVELHRVAKRFGERNGELHDGILHFLFTFVCRFFHESLSPCQLFFQPLPTFQ